MKKIRKIAILIESSCVHGQELLLGIARFASIKRTWELVTTSPYHLSESGPQKRSFTWLKRENIEGVIYSSSIYPEDILALNIPCIITTYMVERTPPWPNIIPNSEKICKMAADFFLNKGFKNFAYCGFDLYPWSRQRAEIFQKEITKAGYSVDIYKRPKSKIVGMWENEQKYATDWLKKIPKPVAILTCNDVRGHFLAELCKNTDLKIPDEVSILGIDNDEVVCGICNPPLSSIDMNTRKAGFEAAKLLDSILSGTKANNQKIIVEPTYILERGSTDILAVENQDVAKALKYIRENAKELIQISDVAQHVSASVRTLQRHFNEVLGRSIGKEIKRVRIERISQMLLETDLTIYQISDEFGFSDSTHMIRLFKNIKKITPSEYRKKYAYRNNK
jgi:LacI family transcriptional regulator